MHRTCIGAFLLLMGCSQVTELCVVDEHLDVYLEKDIPQDVNILESAAAQAEDVFQGQQARFDKEFNGIFFSPWEDTFCAPTLEDIAPEWETLSKHHAENLHKWPIREVLRIKENARLHSYPSTHIRAIAIQNTMAYRAPTEKPFFKNIKLPGSIYSFNENIISLIRIGTPLKIHHASASGDWFLVSIYLFSGWVKAQDVALVEDNFIKKYRRHILHVCINEQTPLVSRYGRFLSSAYVGTVLPGTKRGVLVPHATDDGYARVTECPSFSFVEKPYQFTKEHLLDITRKLIGTKYGWGGYLCNRDCSLMTHDFLAVFGIFIPRNSYAQLTGGKHTHLRRTENKKAFLKAQAIPFLTLVGWGGHVMLYVGFYKGEPIFLQNVWGIKIGENATGRYVLGKTSLNTLSFDQSVRNAVQPLFNDKLEYMRIVVGDPRTP